MVKRPLLYRFFHDAKRFPGLTNGRLGHLDAFPGTLGTEKGLASLTADALVHGLDRGVDLFQVQFCLTDG